MAPKQAFAVSSPLLAVSFAPCWLQVVPERGNTHAAPAPALSSGPPISATVSPSAASATLTPKKPSAAPLPRFWPVSFAPCWVQVVPERVNAHAAPAPLCRPAPPISAVLPSEDSATLSPKRPPFAALFPAFGRSAFAPCWLQVVAFSARVKTHAAPVLCCCRRRPDQRVGRARAGFGGQRHARAEFAFFFSLFAAFGR